MKILVTGGAGYIGSHALVELIQQQYEPVVVDNFCNSSVEVLAQVKKITDHEIPYYAVDIRNEKALTQIFLEHPDIQAVMHFAGLKAVAESVSQPVLYYDNNVNGTLSLLKAMQSSNCKTFIFSSSATVYQESSNLPLREDHALSPINPYGRSKLIIENILRDLYAADNTWRIAILRYFNPVGAHSSGLIGENPQGIPNNLMPYIAQVACGQRDKLMVFGNDYPTVDGTGVRDYVHVVDLAKGHIKALEALPEHTFLTVNLGIGKGYSVLQVLETFEKASGKEIPYEIVGRRVGDIAECYADPSLAKELIQWQAEKNLSQVCEDVWRWQVSE
jgi:UDP-glucose 4-epimerase